MEHFDSTKGAGSGAHLREAVTRAIGCNSHSGIVPQAKRGCKPVFPGCIGLLYKGCLLQNWGSLRDFIISHLYTFLMILSPMGYSVQAVPSKQEQHPNRLGCRWEVSIPEKYQPQNWRSRFFPPSNGVDFLSQPLSEFHAISCLRVHESLQYHSVCKANPLLNFWKFKTPSKPCDGFPLLCVTNNAPVYLWEAWKRHKSKASNFLMYRGFPLQIYSNEYTIWHRYIDDIII